MTHRVVVGLALFSVSIGASSQIANARQAVRSTQAQGVPVPGMPPPGTPRDGRMAGQTGTAIVRGRVIAADSSRPLRRARITVTEPDLGVTFSASTNTDGRYEIRDLPAGRYTVSVTRSGYLRWTYGQRRAFEQGKLLHVLEKQVVGNVDFVLPRMSLITGRIYDEAGEAISDVQVLAMRAMYYDGRRRLVPVAGGGIAARTDDVGQYRMLGLVPGTYLVMATMRETWAISENGREQMFGYAPTYFPGTMSLKDAREVTVGVGQEASHTDFALIPGRAADVSGRVFDSQGRPFAGGQVRISQDYRGAGFGGVIMLGGPTVTVAADGTFRIRSLAPGEYKLRVGGTADVGGTSTLEAATHSIEIAGVDLENVTLTTSRGWSIDGRVMAENGLPPNIARERFRVVLKLANGDQASGQVREDWTFSLTATGGPARLVVPAVPDGWVLKAVLQNGRDVMDAVIEARNGEMVSGLQIVLSNRVSSVTGQLTDDRGAAMADGTIIVFSNNPDRWGEDSRFVRSARPDQEGRYQVRGLPPGDYVAVAVDYVEEGMWNAPEYLASIRRFGQPLTLGEGDTQRVSLKLVSP